ncbi:MAG: ABC transporter substrate-binding protein, partial [Candidatus Omnitrophota bacterium]
MVRSGNKYIVLLIVSFSFASKILNAKVWQDPVEDYTLECGIPGGRLTLAITGDPKSFNPIVAKETSTTQITAYLFEGLTKQDPRTLEVLPNLARRWHTDDGIAWTFYLRDDVYFSDGKHFSADDVVFTFNELIYNPDIPSSSRDILTIEGKKIIVEKVDAYTVKITLPSVFSPFLRAVGGVEILPKHKYHTLVSEKKFNFSMGLGSKTSDIVGSGPFLLRRYLPSQQVVLEKNPYYWQKDVCGRQLPYLEEIVFIILANPETVLLKFLEKEI